MTRRSLPPLLRGIGTTILLIAALIGFLTARRDVHDNKARPQGYSEEDFTNEVLENPSFEWLGFIGTAVVAGSFYVEAFIRQKEDV